MFQIQKASFLSLKFKTLLFNKKSKNALHKYFNVIEFKHFMRFTIINIATTLAWMKIEI